VEAPSECGRLGGLPVTYDSLVDDYLSEAHRNRPGTGCPASALAGDIVRSDKQTRALVAGKIRDNLELMANLVRDTNQWDKGKRGESIVRSRAILTYCARRGHQRGSRGVGRRAFARNPEGRGATSEESHLVKFPRDYGADKLTQCSATGLVVGFFGDLLRWRWLI
jgi:hypothetical protein